MTKYGHASIYFFMENQGKKGILLTFLAHDPNNVVLTELTFFGPNMGMAAGVFHKKLKKITSEHIVFESMDVFLAKIGVPSDGKNPVMSIFCRKIVHSLKNTLLTCNFFQIFHKKTPAVMPIFGPKIVNFLETILYFYSKTSIRYLFF